MCPNQTLNLLQSKIHLLLCMCVLFYPSFVCISAYVNNYFKTWTTTIKQNIILIAEVPSSQALPGFFSTLPPSICVPEVIGVPTAWISNPKKKEKSAHSCPKQKNRRSSWTGKIKKKREFFLFSFFFFYTWERKSQSEKFNSFLGSVLAQMAFPLHASKISDKSERGRGKHVSVPAESSNFFPFKKVLYRRGQYVTFFGKDMTENVISSKKTFLVLERHILSRNVMRHNFCHRKSDKCDVTHPNMRREPGKKFG